MKVEPHIICRANPNYTIDEVGRLLAYHQSDPDFNVYKFINFVKERYRISWKEMFWKVSAFSYYTKCNECEETFVLPKAYCCSYHDSHPTTAYGGNNQLYVCCGLKNERFTVIPRRTGCKTKLHVFD